MPLNLNALLAERAGEKFELFDQYLNAQLVRVLKTIGFDRTYVRAEGPYLYDDAGKKYLDLLSGWGVFALGRNHPVVINALQQVLHGQLAGLVQMDVSLLAGLLAEKLLALTPWLEKAFFCNSGAEAVEAAIKFSRAATGRSKIVYCDHGFHGLTYGPLSLNGDALFRKGFEPLVGDCAPVPFNDATALEQAVKGRDVAAFIVEPVQGKGVNIPSETYLQDAQRLCRAAGTLFVADEIQTGMGRTGTFLASEHWGVEPDIVCLAKALSGGFVPVGAVLTRREIFDRVFDRMDRAVVHGSTFAKNDLAMAAGLATLTVMEDDGIVARAAAVGERLIGALRDRLAPRDFVREVRGKGMMIAIEFGAPKALKLKGAYAMLEAANRGLFCQLILIPLFQKHRILAQVAGHNMPVIKLLPPLTISDSDVTWVVDAFEAVVRDAESLGGIWELGRTLAGQAIKTKVRVA
ncbi:MAG: aspartate aminotransferase family protein [Hyphomicrobiales bacterium]|nr:aspartate aminotransferase family protein [Hyphomicrobiales bacterium]